MIERRPLAGYPCSDAEGTPVACGAASPNPAGDERYAYSGQPLVLVCRLPGPQVTIPAACASEQHPAWALTGGWRYFRLQVEGPFARFYLAPSRRYWRVQLKGGHLLELGDVPGAATRGVEVSADNDRAILRWRLVRQSDALHQDGGEPLNRVEYRWDRLGQRGLLYLTDVFDTPRASGHQGDGDFAHHTTLTWEPPDFPQTHYADPFKATPDLRLARVSVASMPWSGTGPREIVRTYFLDYHPAQVLNTMERSALLQSGIVQRNAVIMDQLRAGADSFTVPYWNDLANDEANVVNDDPEDFAIPHKLTAGKMVTRKAFLHNSWSAMNLASELSGDDALPRIQSRVEAYWTRQAQRRLIATLNGILADNIANDAGDMVLDLSGEAAVFSAEGVIDAAGTLGDQMGSVAGIAMHSDVYRLALKADLIETVQESAGRAFQTFRGMAVIVDDLLPVDTTDSDAPPVYTSVLFTPGAVGWGMAAPRVAEGTEIESKPSAGNGGGQQILHSRVNLAIHPAGFTWTESAVVGDSPTIAELANPANWDRVVERKAAGLAFLKTLLSFGS